MGFPLRLPRFTLFLMIWHVAIIILCFLNWRFFMSAEESMLSQQLPRIYLGFNIIGVLAYVFAGSLLMFWPYRYGAFMLPKNRRNKLMMGVAVSYFSHILPIWLMEFVVIWNFGWFNLIQGASFVLLTMTWSLETLGVWYMYVWQLSGYLDRHYGRTKFGQGASRMPREAK
eukprot:TRINITY_DN49697_c0_g1_i1.p1 TRINITY_DN49697_c0_g1~~TRINITY_DN49697_c0_g1_i1.p1  ORF type:complete len:171 (+),score=25.97 TRINITY_DN49697_c0_g1_i1:335-847(+)